VIRVGVSGAAGRVGSAVCEAVESADDLELTGRADPQLGVALADILGDCDVVVDFTTPDAALDNALACLRAGVHAVIGTTGWDPSPLREFRPHPPTPHRANVFVAPNFAIGAVLMMRFAVEASKYMAKAEIIELHHDGKLDAPSGTAKRTAELMAGDVPIHSVRLPGLVAHQEVLLGGQGQLLTIRHDTLSREAFVPGVLLALERLGDLPAGVTMGIDGLVA
jgi:4-hydroxy-tetrahydrodipicolinate reductase